MFKAVGADPQAGVQFSPEKPVVPYTFTGRLLQMLSERGGTLYCGHRALGEALGCSPHIGKVLRELSDAGR